MKLDNIPKKQIFNIPDGYFDHLPAKIQARIDQKKQPAGSFLFQYKLQYVLPFIMLIVIAGIWWARPVQTQDVETMLAGIETEYIVAYLNDSELTTEDVLEEVTFDTNEVEEIESEIYQLQLEDEVFDELVNEL